jgi:menaquinone-specific isochorismate synthase
MRGGEGIIGFGEIARFEAASLAEAAGQWNAFTKTLAHRSLIPHAHPLAFVSGVFDPSNSAGMSVIVVPESTITVRHGKAWFTTFNENLSVPEVITAPVPPMPLAEITPNGLDGREWKRAVTQAIELLAQDCELEKVVLARAVTAKTASPISLRQLATHLSAQYKNCWTFIVDGMVGASPELLIRLEDGLATSRVLAGTIPREGSTEKLSQVLIDSDKDLREHEYARDSVAQALEPFCSAMNVPDAPSVLRLPNVLHLASDITGIVHDSSTSALDLALALHPSAAVCGTPTALARQAIAELEQLDRGRYAGPIGWVDTSGNGEIAIALRCGKLNDNDPRQIELYAGCGIISESDPEAEYAETQAKLLPMLNALGR